MTAGPARSPLDNETRSEVLALAAEIGLFFSKSDCVTSTKRGVQFGWQEPSRQKVVPIVPLNSW
jgi:hypothetical protein